MPLPVRAATWRGEGAGSAAAFAKDGRALMRLTCSGGALRLFAASPGLAAGGGRRSIGLGVDGTAFLLEGEPVGRGAAAGLSAGVPAGQSAALIGALRRGKAGELRVPAGRYGVALDGSGAALAPLAAACGA